MNINSQAADIDISLLDIYGEKDLAYQKNRYRKLGTGFENIFKKLPEKYFSAPGRTELSGNHTDHNHGKVLAASINLDSIAAVSANNSSNVIFYSERYIEPFVIDLTNLKMVDEEKASTKALIRGIAAELKKRGYNVGGFNVLISSDVIVGSGLSSSASIEVLTGTIFNHLFNDGKISSEEIAIIGQYSENNYFGKPCGLMDQLACATGGIISIDFFNPVKPVIKKINFNFSTSGYKLIVVDTEASHADLTDDYKAIPQEMKDVAKYFNKDYCSELSFEELLPEIKSLRKKSGDRAILRAVHFLEENKRVEKQTEALNKNNFEDFLKLVNASGNSSFMYLQNVYSPNNIKEQGVSLALALSSIFIKEKGKGACRVHGGGFAGTIQLFLPEDLVDEYLIYITKVFREDSVKILSIRNYGAVCVNNS